MAAGGSCFCREDRLERECCRGGLLRAGASAGFGAHIPDGEEDRISALPDDMLLQVLTRLRCARAAAHTSLLARRWRGLWARLPELTFHSTEPDLLDAALARVARPAAPSLLDIDFFNHHKFEPRRVAAALALAELVVHVYAGFRREAIEMPCFDRTTSIKLEVPHVGFRLPPAGGFPALENLHLEDCHIDLVDLLPRCPRLHKLDIINWNSDSVMVESPSLLELVVNADVEIRHINIVAPALKELYLDAHRGISKDFSLSYSAPAVEDLTWKRECQAISYKFGVIWRLWNMSLSTSLQPRPGNNIEDTCLQQRPLFRFLWLYMETNVYSGDASKSFEQEIFQYLFTDFSVLELDLTPRGHVYGAMVLYLLGLYTSIEKLNIELDLDMSRACPADCLCDQPSNWRSQTILLTDLKEVEIRGFKGKGHEVDLLKVLLRCAAMLERVTLSFSCEASPSDIECMEIHSIFEAYPFVECRIYRKLGSRFCRYELGCS